MIKIFVVSNAKHKELAKFLEQRGTFSVVGSYNSISENAISIQSDILKVDKTLYLYQVDSDGTSTTNIRSDMQYLKKMLQTNSFFDPGEIIFMTQDNSHCKQAIKYFMSVMESCQYKKYSVKTISDVISYIAVYDNLMGSSESANFENKYRTLYRKEKDEESTVAYNVTDNSDDRIEPFDFRNLKDFDGQKRLTAKAMSSVKFRDSSETEIDTYDNPVFNGLNLISVLDGPEVIVLTGKAKSGLSVWTSALAVSAFNDGKNVLVLDYTSNSDILSTLNSCNIEITDIDMKSILRKDFGTNEQVNVLRIFNDAEDSVRLNFVRKIFSDFELPYDCIFIATQEEDLNNLVTMLGRSIKHVILTVVPRHADVVYMQKYIDLLKDLNVVVAMNKCIDLRWEQFLSQREVKDLLTFMNPRVVNHVDFDTVNVGPDLYEAISSL